MYIWFPGDLVKMQIPIHQVRARAWDYALLMSSQEMPPLLVHEPHSGLSMSQILVVFPSEQGHDLIYQNLQPSRIINTDHLGGLFAKSKDPPLFKSISSGLCLMTLLLHPVHSHRGCLTQQQGPLKDSQRTRWWRVGRKHPNCLPFLYFLYELFK